MLTDDLYTRVKVNKTQRVTVYSSFNKAAASARRHYGDLSKIPDTVRVIKLTPVEAIRIEK